VDHGVLPLGLIRAGKIVFANDRLVDYLGRTRDELVGTPFLDHVAPADRARVAERHARRVRGEAVPSSYDIELVRKDGSSRHAEVHVAFEPSGDVAFELADRTPVVARRMQLRELAGLGAAVQREHTEELIFETLGRGLVELGIGWARVEPDGDALVVVDVGSPNDSVQRLERELNASLRGLRGPWGDEGARAWRDGSAYLDDLPLSADTFFGTHGAAARTVAQGAAMGRSIILRIDVQQKPWQLLFVMADWLLEEDLTSFGLLRIQVSAALDAARVIADLSARNDELAALNSIGAAAGAGIALDALFTLMAQTITRLLGQEWLSIYLFDDETGDALLAHQFGFSPDVGSAFARIPAGSKIGGVARTAKPVFWRWREMSDDTNKMLEKLGMKFALVVSVPLVAGARVIGAMNTGYASEALMLPSHVEVLQAAGAHFAAALQAKGLLDDLRRSYGDLARTQEQLVQRERLAALGELAAIVAHEIRNPLGAVFNAIGAIRHQAEASKGSRLATLLAILEEEAKRMNDIVGDLLDFARPVSAALRPEHIESIVIEALEAATHDAAGPVKVERHVDAKLPAVPIDGRLLRQAILNVALNAVQALGARGGTLTLRMKNDRGGVLIEITDTGPGIASEHQARVFEPFFTTRASGTGLGLTVVKRIVDVHHGETTLHTEPGKGTTFAIRLPVVSS
jgi:PAS domain S-box-containing protein